MAEDILRGKKVAILATDYFEESELLNPKATLEEAGAETTVIAPHEGAIKGLQHVEPGEEVPVDIPLDEADPEDYHALVVPGGALNADHIRVEEKAQTFVRSFLETGKPVAVICHGPWLLVSAKVVKGRTLTSYHTIADDIKNAGGIWVDEEVVVDDNLITSRSPDDLPAFNEALVTALENQEITDFVESEEAW